MSWGEFVTPAEVAPWVVVEGSAGVYVGWL